MKKVIHHIKKIRKQPVHIRKTILHIATIFFAVILFLLWLYSFGTIATSEESKRQINQDIKPFSVIKDNITSQYNNLSDLDKEVTE